MDRTATAQRLVEIADELDSLGLIEEANEVDSIVQAMATGRMEKQAMAYDYMMGAPSNMPGPSDKLDRYQDQVARIDQQILRHRQEILKLSQRKEDLALMGSVLRKRNPEEFSAPTGKPYNAGEAMAQLQATQQAAEQSQMLA